MKMPFGKYKGWDVQNTPKQYLEWVLANVKLKSYDLVDAIWLRVYGISWSHCEVIEQEQEQEDFYERLSSHS